MPMYFFDVVEINGITREDTVGVELSDTKAAQALAKRTLADMSREAINEDLSEVRIDVRDDAGNRVALRVAHFDKDESDE